MSPCLEPIRGSQLAHGWGTRLQDPPRGWGAEGEAARTGQQSCSRGQAGGGAATDIPQGHPEEGRGIKAQTPWVPAASRGEKGLCGCSMWDPQHQQVFEEFPGPSGLPSSSSSSARASSLLACVRRPSSSFLWACSTSSVRRVKDWETKEHSYSGVSSSSPGIPVTARGAALI